MAPEVFAGKFSQECDIWACGIFMHKLVTDHYPYPPALSVKEIGRLAAQMNSKELVVSIDGLSEKGKNFLSCLLDKRKSTRITAQQALQHPWLSSANNASMRVAPRDDIMDHLRKFRVLIFADFRSQTVCIIQSTISSPRTSHQNRRRLS